MPANMDFFKDKKGNEGTLSVWQKAGLLLKLRKAIKTIPQPMKLNGSWKTSVFGTGGIGFLLFDTIAKLVDGDSSTNPDWALVVSALVTAVGLIFAKDANVSNASHPIAKAQPVD